ncbi:hypothetical protein Tco_0871847 [Tanacetum coccineum]
MSLVMLLEHCYASFDLVYLESLIIRTILDICLRVEGVDFTDVPDDDIALTFLIDLGYKGPLYKHTNMFVDHMHQPLRTLAAMINKCLSGKTTSNDKLRKLITGKKRDQDVKTCHIPDSSKSSLKFVKIDGDYQEYGLPIPETMLTDAIKQSESYHMFIKYSTGQIPPNKSKGKGSKGKKIKTSSKRRVKKKVTLSADDNIIFDDPDAALKLAKSISKTKAEEAEAARQVHATHARTVTKSVPESAKKNYGGRSSKSVVIQDTPSAPKSKPTTSKTKLKGALSLTQEEQEAVDIMQALKEIKKTSKRQPGIRGSIKGTRSKPGVPNKSTVVFDTSSEGTDSEYSDDDNDGKPGVPDEEKDRTEEKVILEWGDEQDSEYSDDDNDDVEKDDKYGDADDEGNDHISDTQDADDEDVKTESDEDDIYKYKICVRKDEDEKMLNVEVDGSDKGDEEVIDAAKADAEKTLEVKDDAKKTDSLHQALAYLTIKDTTDLEINSLLEVKIQSKVPHTQSPSMLSVPVSMNSEPTVLTPVQESSLIATVTTLPPPSVSTTPHLRVAKLEKDVSDLKKIDLSVEALAALKTQVPSVVDNYLGSKFSESSKKQTLTVDLEQGSKKSASEILKIKREQAKMKQTPKFTIKNPINHRLYHVLMEALIEDENVMDKGVADTVKDHKRKHDDDEDDDDEDPPARPNQGKKTKRRRTKESESSKKPSSTKEIPNSKAPTKGSKTGKSTSAKEPVEEPIAEVVMDEAGDDVVHDKDQPQDASKPKTTKTLNPDWFKQPPRPSTLDPEWNKRQVVLDQPKQPWFNQMVFATKDLLTFNDLMATPIDFSKYVMNGLKIENLTQDILLGPAFNLLKGTCSSSIELEYNFQECFNALTDKLDWNNLEVDHYPFDLSKPLPLQGPQVTYTTSFTKTKTARYEIKGIEDMVSKFSKQNVYSTKAILGMKSVSVKKLHGYGHLEEIMVKRSDQQIYKFKEGDFVDLHLNDIEDMLLLAVQHKLFHLDGSDIVDFIVALRMFTRSLILKRRVEDLQLSVESYQKKLNITKPQKTFPEIKFKEPYTPSYDPPRIVYEDLNKQKRVLRADELYKFSDGTLKSVRDEIHHRVLDFRLDYNNEMPMRKWTAVDRKRSGLMIKLIDKQLREMEIIINLERLVGAREHEMDYKLMTRTT